MSNLDQITITGLPEVHAQTEALATTAIPAEIYEPFAEHPVATVLGAAALVAAIGVAADLLSKKITNRPR